MPRGPIVIDSFSARLSIRPWGNCKTYSTSYSWWILRVSKVWSSPDDHVNTISKACLWYSDFQQEHLEPKAKSFLLNYPNTVVWVVSWKLSPLPKEFSTLYPVMDIMLCLSLGRIYPWYTCLSTLSFPLFCTNFLVNYLTEHGNPLLR